jgi:hypothetical protein
MKTVAVPDRTKLVGCAMVLLVLGWTGCKARRSFVEPPSPKLKKIEAEMSQALAEADELYVEFYDISNANLPSQSFVIADRQVIHRLRDAFHITGRIPATVWQVPCLFHVELAIDDSVGVYLLGGGNAVALYPDLRVDREFETDHYLAKIDQEFVDILNEYFETQHLSEIMLPR